MANFNFYTAIPASIYMALRQSIKIRELKRLFKYWIFLVHNNRKIFAQSVDFLHLGKIIGLGYFVLLNCPDVEGDTGCKNI